MSQDKNNSFQVEPTVKGEGKDTGVRFPTKYPWLEGGEGIKITREWAMPSRHTFTIEPIRLLLNRYVGDGDGWVDPFAGEYSPAEITNDLNPKKPTNYHLHALEFTAIVPDERIGVLFDPPYSPRQIKECYQSIGLAATKQDMQGFGAVKRAISEKIEPGGFAITCGWNSNGFGKKLGFKLIELLIVAHGANHNDTIVTVEKKTVYGPTE